jgi:dTDP-4-amino-4,6-dideoxygalactose transaminase
LPHAWEFIHDEIGYNNRLPNINAALGCAQLEQLPDKLIAKRALFKLYQEAFASVEGVELVTEPAQCLSNYWLQTIILSFDQANLRDTVLQATNQAGFMSRPVWRLMHQLTTYSNCPQMELSTAEQLSQRLINIPSSPSLLPQAE